jgi:hypothetical protein
VLMLRASFKHTHILPAVRGGQNKAGLYADRSQGAEACEARERCSYHCATGVRRNKHKGANVLPKVPLVVGGGIAAYKSSEFVRYRAVARMSPASLTQSRQHHPGCHRLRHEIKFTPAC